MEDEIHEILSCGVMSIMYACTAGGSPIMSPLMVFDTNNISIEVLEASVAYAIAPPSADESIT